MDDKKRCGWVKLSDAEYVAYHDKEWGRTLHDDNELFEIFSLETQSSGLSWLTILKKREGYREVFYGFDLHKVAAFDETDIERILESGKVVKSKPKISAIINNAKIFVEIQKESGSLDKFFWDLVDGEPIIHDVEDYKTAPCGLDISKNLTKNLKKRGMKFVGETMIYSFMQSCGMVDDHENSCFCKTK